MLFQPTAATNFGLRVSPARLCLRTHPSERRVHKHRAEKDAPLWTETIQAIPRHSNVGITMNICVKSVAESQVKAVSVLSAELLSEPTLNDLATGGKHFVN
jgi:hypothetical protein